MKRLRVEWGSKMNDLLMWTQRELDVNLIQN